MEVDLPDIEMSGGEWLDLYRYLLAKLATLGLNEVRSEIEAAASAPVVEESTPEEEARISKLIRGEVGKAIIRRRDPSEVFHTALGVLHSRLIEMPAVAVALANNLKVSAARIEFRVDYEQRYALVESKPLLLNDFLVTADDLGVIRAGLSTLGISDRR